MISGLFFGGASGPPTNGNNSTTFIKADTATMGNWVGRYGVEGFEVSQDGNINIPGYAQIAFANQANWTWAASTNSLPALQKPENPIDRIAGTWFSGNAFTIDVNLTDGNNHQIALYALDYDTSARAETIRVLDGSTGAVLDSTALSAGSFHNGVYLVWNVKGHVTFQVNKNAGSNAVISGLFFDSASDVLIYRKNGNNDGQDLTETILTRQCERRHIWQTFFNSPRWRGVRAAFIQIECEHYHWRHAGSPKRRLCHDPQK